MAKIIIGLGNKCIDVFGANSSNGAEIGIWEQNGGSNQMWNLTPEGYIESSMDTGKCLDIQGGVANNGTPIILWEKNGGDNQKWMLDSDGCLVSYLNPKRCIDVPGAENRNGVPLVLWDKNNGINQKWRLDECTNPVNNYMTEIEIKYKQVKNTYPYIGDPNGSEQICPDGQGHFQHYSGGSIYWTTGTGAHLIYGLIKAKWANLGWEKSVLGYPSTDELNAGSGNGSRYNNFQYGTIIWKNNTNEAFAVFGPILAQWAIKNWDSGELGFPIEDEQIIIDVTGIHRAQRFEQGELMELLHDGDFIKSSVHNEIYRLQNNQRCHVPDPETLLSMTTFDKVIILLNAEVDAIPLGNAIESVADNPGINNFNNIHVCVDKITGNNTNLPPRKGLPVLNNIKINRDGTLSEMGINQAPLTGITEKFWDIGQTIRIKMIGGSSFVRSKVRQFALVWTQYANIHFQFVGDPDHADIRVSFETGKGSWSMIGRDVLWVPFDIPTMNFGWFDDGTSDSEFSRVVVHEFGHALGLVHEHQSPAAGIKWDKEKVYAFYKKLDNWDKAYVDENVFHKYSMNETNFSQYDPLSIMHYNIPAELTLDKTGTPTNQNLSSTDIEFIKRWYPFPPSINNASGLLHTQDDCDEIDFLVEYNVMDKSQIQFVLSGIPNKVTWWKAIEIPADGSQYRMLFTENGIASSMIVLMDAIDTSRPIRFWKAKMFGVHTLINYTWDVISAIPGGSRVSLTWKRDKC